MRSERKCGVFLPLETADISCYIEPLRACLVLYFSGQSSIFCPRLASPIYRRYTYIHKIRCTYYSIVRTEMTLLEDCAHIYNWCAWFTE